MNPPQLFVATDAWLDYRCALGKETKVEGRRDKPPELAESLYFLTREVHELHKALSTIINNSAVLNRIAEMETRIMGKVTDFAVAQKAFNERQAVAIDKLAAAATTQATATTGLAEDIKTLNDKITELQNSSGGVTPEDGVLIDELQAQGEALTARAEGVATAAEAQAAALEALDSQTPPVVPPVPPTA